MPATVTVRVSANSDSNSQYGGGLLDYFLTNNCYAAWIGDTFTSTLDERKRVTVPFAGRVVDAGAKIYSAYIRICAAVQRGDTIRFIMRKRDGAKEGLYVGTVNGLVSERVCLDCVAGDDSVRGIVHKFRRAPFVRECEEKAARAAAQGFPFEVYEVFFHVDWVRLEAPTGPQLDWASGVQGTFVFRTVDFPEVPPAAPAPAEPEPEPEPEPSPENLLRAELQAARAEIDRLRAAMDSARALLA